MRRGEWSREEKNRKRGPSTVSRYGSGGGVKSVGWRKKENNEKCSSMGSEEGPIVELGDTAFDFDDDDGNDDWRLEHGHAQRSALPSYPAFVALASVLNGVRVRFQRSHLA